MRKTKRAFAILLTVCLMAGLMPTTAFAADIQADTPTFTVNTSTVAFAGHEWWVIGNGTNGVNPVNGTLTLLAKNDEFGDSAFRTGSSSSFDNSTQYSGDSWYYAGTGWTTPNEYAGSTLQQKMESIAGNFDSRESALIKAQNLTEGMNGSSVVGQKLWALSESEWNTINNNTVRSYGDWWWLRSPYPTFGAEAKLGAYDGGYVRSASVFNVSSAVRPALNLDLTSVLFTSDASATSGKSSAAAGGNLVGASAPTGTVKFTVKDTQNQKLTVEATDAQKTQSGADSLNFIYSGATTGTNQYLSCVLTDSTGTVQYYGKLKDCADSSAAKGALSVPLTGVADGTYTLEIFSEQANADLYTDFASEPVTMTVTVSNGTGTVSNYAGSDHTHDYQYTYLNDTQHEGVCYCTDSQTANHTGGTATCTSAKVCTACNQSYGSALGHDWSDWTNTGDAQQHTRTCNRVSSHTETATHSYDGDADMFCNDCTYDRTPAPARYSVTVSADPAEGGTVSGGGIFDENTSVTVTASEHSGYKFVEWQEGGNRVSTDASHQFTVTASRTLFAVFALEQTEPEPTPTPTEPTPEPTDEIDDVPDTGDDSNIGLLIGLSMIAAAGIVVCGLLWRRKRAR